jgi:uncharacterized membrane protein
VLIAYYFLWWFDPAGAICVALYIMINWAITGLRTSSSTIVHSVSDDETGTQNRNAAINLFLCFLLLSFSLTNGYFVQVKSKFSLVEVQVKNFCNNSRFYVGIITQKSKPLILFGTQLISKKH